MEKEPVLPGNLHRLKFITTLQMLPFQKSIDVFSNDPVNGRVVLYIQGTVDAKTEEEKLLAPKK